MTHAARALQSHDLSGRELNYGSHTYFFHHTRTWRASPDEWSAQCQGHLRDGTNMKDNTHQARTQSSQQGEYRMMLRRPNDIRGPWALKFPDICLTGEEKPRKPRPGNMSRPRIEPGPAAWQARMLTHATTCSTAVDYSFLLSSKLRYALSW